MSERLLPAKFAPALGEFCQQLREAGLAVGTSELVDSFAALKLVGWVTRQQFHRALSATIAKSPQDQAIFDAVFDRFFFQQAEAGALGLEQFDSGMSMQPEARIDQQSLRERARDAISAGDEAAMIDLAQLAIASFGGHGQPSGVAAVDLQRVRRLVTQPGDGQQQRPTDGSLPTVNLRRFDYHLRRELARVSTAGSGVAPSDGRSLSELGRSTQSVQLDNLADVNRVVSQLKRRLATAGSRNGGNNKRRQIDLRHTLRASLQTGGVPVDLRYRPVKPRRPELFVLCDVSTSVSSASMFFLSVLHALHDSIRKLRSFVFIEQVAEVTEIFMQERDIKTANRRINHEAAVADRSGYTDYGRVWSSLFYQAAAEIGPRSTLIVLGDARTNGRDAGLETFTALSQLAGRTYWLNPEPASYWNYGDSVIAQYEKVCPVFECWNVSQLEAVTKQIWR